MPNEPQVRESAEFTGKRILVTGGTRGIGAAIVHRMMRGDGKVPDEAPKTHFYRPNITSPKRVIEP